jgi:aldose sugar dehydrogenase
MTSLPTLAALLLLVLPALGQDALRSPTPKSTVLPGRQVDVTGGLEHPWGLVFLPDGRMLVTERPGRLRIVSGGKLSEPLDGVPQVRAGGQGGLLDVALSPSFAQDRLVYLSFSEPGEGGAGTAVARGRLGAHGLEETQTIWRQQPKGGSSLHWGSRLVFRPDGTLFVTLGDRGTRDYAQDLATTVGKVVRINTDGTIPKDNPFVGRDGARPEIWSYGHRNAQGAALDAQGQLWTVEHGRARRRRAEQSPAGP